MQVTIYKTDSKDKIRVLNIFTEGNKIHQLSGILGGNLVSNVSECIGKNIGKSNETTPEQQAVLEAQAKYIKKLDEGYFKTVEEAQKIEVILPMLAKSFDSEKKKIDWNTAFVQPKLDGMRCLKKGEEMISRKGKLIETLPHIAKEAYHMVDYLDGELYAHGLSFQENMKLIKKNRPESINVKYHVYDMVLPNMSFRERNLILEKMIRVGNFNHLELVPTYRVYSIEEVHAYHIKFIQEGYEGTMIRWGTEGYKTNGRSSNLLKYKDFLDLACKVVNIVPSEKIPNQGVVECEYKGQTFRCGMKFSHSEREEILTNKSKYLHQIAEIRFFEYTDGGIPRFPVCVGFRLDK